MTLLPGILFTIIVVNGKMMVFLNGGESRGIDGGEKTLLSDEKISR